MTDDLDRIEEALSFVSADVDRKTWVRMALAIKSAARGDDGFDIFDKWSKTAASKYDAKDAKTVWKLAKPKLITIGSLFHEAKAHGWRPGNKRPYIQPQPRPEPEPDDDEDERRRQKWALEQWRRARAIGGTLVEIYLRIRGIDLTPDLLTGEVLRFDPDHSFGEHGKHPTMLALYRNITSDQPKTIHRTALLKDGSDRIRLERDGWKGKKMGSPCGGAVIKLSADAEVTDGLGLTEGIENALTMICMGWRSVWACGSDWAVSVFPVLSGIEALTVFGDPGKPGEDAAEEVKARWLAAGKECRVRIPKIKGDWNEVIRSSG